MVLSRQHCRQEILVPSRQHFYLEAMVPSRRREMLLQLRATVLLAAVMLQCHSVLVAKSHHHNSLVSDVEVEPTSYATYH